MNESQVRLAFFVAGKHYAERIWAQVPRKGDVVMLGLPKAAYTVKRVVWGVEPEDGSDPRQCADVYVVTARDVRAK